MKAEELFKLAEEYNLQEEVIDCLNTGMSVNETARMWDLNK